MLCVFYVMHQLRSVQGNELALVRMGPTMSVSMCCGEERILKFVEFSARG